jgi:hypothetical protein
MQAIRLNKHGKKKSSRISAWRSGSNEGEKSGGLASCPYAGINRIRFNGFPLGRSQAVTSHPTDVVYIT